MNSGSGNQKKRSKDVSLLAALVPLLFAIGFLVYAQVIRAATDQEPFSLEVVFLAACIFVSVQLLSMGYKWKSIFKSATDKIAQALPTLLILLAIGMIIGSWIVCGTIPMFVYYGIKMINPDYIYLICFFVPIIFSMMTGTSWGSVGTVGVVLMGVATSMNAELPIAAAAVIGGSFFGDKLSPLSDTTNIAALAVDISVYDHIKSMLYTTIPAALFAAVFFTVMGFTHPAEVNKSDAHLVNPNQLEHVEGEFEIVSTTVSSEVVEQPAQVKANEILKDIERSFNFNWLLFIPPIIVLWGSLKKYPPVAVLITSSVSAVMLAFFFQPFAVNDVLNSLVTGFSTTMIDTAPVGETVAGLFTRGGLYGMKGPFMVSIFVFAFVGLLGHIDAMGVIVRKTLAWVKTRGGTVRAALISSAIVNALTSNQYANSFIVGDAFKEKFKHKNIARRVLSRSLEDTGTMIESLVPWHLTAVFIVTTLGVAVKDYWYYQVFTLSNIAIAFLFTFIGYAIFKRK